MLEPADAARRRELQQRAFAPGGGLSAAEAAELGILNARQHAMPANHLGAETPDVGPNPANGPTPAAPTREVARADAAHADVRPAAEAPAAAEQQASETRPPSPGTRGRLLLGALVVVAVALGFAAGWAVSRGTATARPGMTAEQQKTWSDLEASEDYDPGSLVFAGGKHGASVWSATRDGGAEHCVVLSYEDRLSSRCLDPAEAQGWEEGVIATDMEVESGDTRVTISAGLVTAASGETVLVVQRYESLSMGWEQQYSDEELRLVEALEGAGLNGDALQIVGYDGDVPIWAALDERACLAVADPATLEVATACDEMPMDGAMHLTVQGSVYSLQWNERRGPVVTVIRTPESGTTCAAQMGDCASIDDTTEEVG